MYLPGVQPSLYQCPVLFQALSPDEDVVACIYLGYNPHCISALYCFRCCPPTRMWWPVCTWGTTFTVSVPCTVSGAVPRRGCGGLYLPGVQPSLYQCLVLFQALSPDEDVVACIYLGYNPHCISALYCFRCCPPTRMWWPVSTWGTTLTVSVPCTVQALSPDEDVVACIYLGYNPHCISALYCFRCCPPTRMWWPVSTWGTTLTVSVPCTVSGAVP